MNRVLVSIAGLGAAALVGCGSTPSPTTAATTTGSASQPTAAPSTAALPPVSAADATLLVNSYGLSGPSSATPADPIVVIASYSADSGTFTAACPKLSGSLPATVNVVYVKGSSGQNVVVVGDATGNVAEAFSAPAGSATGPYSWCGGSPYQAVTVPNL